MAPSQDIGRSAAEITNLNMKLSELEKLLEGARMSYYTSPVPFLTRIHGSDMSTVDGDSVIDKSEKKFIRVLRRSLERSIRNYSDITSVAPSLKGNSATNKPLMSCMDIGASIQGYWREYEDAEDWQKPLISMRLVEMIDLWEVN